MKTMKDELEKFFLPLPALAAVLAACQVGPRGGRNHASIENPPYTRLVLERLWTVGRYWSASVCHYGEQNGDAMRDPEVTLLVDETAAGPRFLPCTFQNDFVGVFTRSLAVAPYDRTVHVTIESRRDLAGLADFCKVWDGNLKDQGWIEAAGGPEVKSYA